jgi:hypothetical protein
MPDADGYGYQADEKSVARLLEDMRTLSGVGIERIAAAWEAHVGTDLAHERLQEAERAALAAAESRDLGETWEDLRRQILDLTEGRSAMHDWRAEHGDTGHKAERAALAAALALTAVGHVTGEHYRTLVAPMADALPWLAIEANSAG